MKKYCIIFNCLFLVLTACVDKYKPEINPAPRNIVVDGMITNVAEPYIISLTYLKNVYDNAADSIPGAIVMVTDNDGNTYPFLEKTKGVYQSDSGLFVGTIGKKYTLKITTKDGQVLESTEELMMDCPKLESVKNMYKGASSGEEGFYVYVTFKDLPEEGNSYRWETIYYPRKARCGEFNGCCDDCFHIRKKPEKFVVSSDQNYNNQMVENQQVYIVPYDSRSVGLIHIVQYSTTASAYQFWKQLGKQISNVGSIFDPEPATIAGNIKNITNEKERIYGLFSVVSKIITPHVIQRDYLSESPNFEILPPPPPGPPPSCLPCKKSTTVTNKKPLGWPL